MILVPTEREGVLVTIATPRYPESGAARRCAFGEGIAGTRGGGAQADSHLGADARHAVRARDAQGPVRLEPRRRPRGSIPLPGLPKPESQLGVPLLVRGELVGVLCLESEMPYRFHEEDKASIELLGSYLAIAIQNMQWQERSADARRTRGAAAGRGPRAPRPAGGGGRDVVYYAATSACSWTAST
jgi:adenylate cyclase